MTHFGAYLCGGAVVIHAYSACIKSVYSDASYLNSVLEVLNDIRISQVGRLLLRELNRLTTSLTGFTRRVIPITAPSVQIVPDTRTFPFANPRDPLAATAQLSQVRGFSRAYSDRGMRMARLASLVCVCPTLLVLAGQDTREIWDTGLRTKRPAAKAAVSSPSTSHEYRLAPNSVKSSIKLAEATPVIGLTMWRLRRPASRDATSPRLLVPDTPSGPKLEYVSERIGLNEPLHAGDRVRLAIESPLEGYVYVINRELYRDGTRGDPYLLFPIETLNKGDNSVSPGRLIEIPGQKDEIPALRLDSNDSRHAGEEVRVIISKSRLSGITASQRPRQLPEDMVETWEREFTSVDSRLDLAAKGGLWTTAERAAGGLQRLLTPEDPMPQSIFITNSDHVRPLMIRILMEVRR